MIVRPRVPHHKAMQWTGDNFAEMESWMGPHLVAHDAPHTLTIQDRSGRVVVRRNEWIVHIDYRWLVISPAVFDAMYEEVKP